MWEEILVEYGDTCRYQDYYVCLVRSVAGLGGGGGGGQGAPPPPLKSFDLGFEK